MQLTISSPAFTSGGLIPGKYTCDGEDRAPALSWDGVPSTVQSLAIIVDDPDAPDPKAPKRTWVHWLLFNLPPNARNLSEGGDDFPGAIEGRNDWNKAEYGGPCPPIGRHRYFFKIYALDVLLPDLQAPTKAELERAMQGHIVAQAELMGTYQKSK